MNSNVILAIETSCDDTCVAILKNNKVLADVIMSSSKNHAKFGGIVPEVAARSHEKNINICFKNCLKQSNVSLEEVTHIVYTNEPGLPGSLHIGKIFAKSLAYLLKVKLIPINHMHGHVFSCLINKANKVKFPFISFIASGGHTTIYLVNSFNDIKVLNQTNDDPIGEMLDKIGRVLKLPYPGGISIDKIYNFKFSNLKLINHNKPEINFSFSGLKTHILNYMNGRNMKKEKVDIKLVASSTLKWIVDDVILKLDFYMKKYKINNLFIGGGVSANNLLRKVLKEQKQWNVFIPEKKYSTDNASMICNYARFII